MALNPWQYAQANTEHAHQVALFMWASKAKLVEPCLDNMLAIPNGGLRDKRVAGRLKAEGVKSSVSDIFLPEPVGLIGMGMYYGLWIELKRIKSTAKQTGIARAAGAKRSDQEEWREKMIAKGYHAVLTYGWQNAVFEICKYLGLDRNRLDEFVQGEYNKAANKK